MAQEDPAEAGQLADLTKLRSSQVLYWRFFTNFGLLVLDLVVYVITFDVIHRIEHERDILYSYRFNFTMSLLLYTVFCALIWIISIRAVGGYKRHVFADGYHLNVLLCEAMLLSLVGIFAMNYLIGVVVPIKNFVLTSVITLVVMMIVRFIVRIYLTRGRQRGAYSYSTVIVGSPRNIEHALRVLHPRSQLSYRPVAICPIREVNGQIMSDHDVEHLERYIREFWNGAIPMIEYSDKLDVKVVETGAQAVMITDVIERFSSNFNTFSVQMESMNLEIVLFASAAEVAGHETSMQTLQGVTIMSIRMPQYTLGALFKKRVFDIIVSSIAIVLTSWLMLIIAIAVKIEDGGPVFYKQERIGLRGRPFKIIKFRSMRVNADAELAKLAQEQGQDFGVRVKIKHDPRITRVGHFIRKTSLDELPQFFNVFLGSMSVVGPRPQRDFEVETYDDELALRLLVKPGITGPWQVEGRNDLSEDESRQLDVTYVQDWSVIGDIIYIMRTIGVVINPKGAY